MLNISSGKQDKPVKVVIYGPEGIGKSTLAAQFPEPLFIDTEGSTARMNVRRTDKPNDWAQLVDTVSEVASTPDVCKTLVIDTADWAEKLCIKFVCDKYKKGGIEDFGYGKGYIYLKEAFAGLLTILERCIEAGINVVFTAHAIMRKFEQPDQMGAYDRWEMKLTKHVAPMVKEWADMVLFCNYKTIVMTGESGNAKVQGGKRVMYTTHHPCWDAKNRDGLPSEVDMDYGQISAAVAGKDKRVMLKPEDLNFEEVPERPMLVKLRELMQRDMILSPYLEQAVASQGYVPEGTAVHDFPDELIAETLIPHWDAVVDVANEFMAKELVPFEHTV